jgi:hypothetical protein
MTYQSFRFFFGGDKIDSITELVAKTQNSLILFNADADIVKTIGTLYQIDLQSIIYRMIGAVMISVIILFISFVVFFFGEDKTHFIFF